MGGNANKMPQYGDSMDTVENEDNEELRKKVNMLQNDNEKLRDNIRTLDNCIDDLRKENVHLSQENKTINKNITLLISTSKAELSKKDDIILQLREEMKEVLSRLSRNLSNNSNQNMDVEQPSTTSTDSRGGRNKNCKRKHTPDSHSSTKKRKTDEFESENKPTIITINVNDVTMEIKRNNINMKPLKNNIKQTMVECLNTDTLNNKTNENCMGWLQRCEELRRESTGNHKNKDLINTRTIKRSNSENISSHDSDETLRSIEYRKIISESGNNKEGSSLIITNTSHERLSTIPQTNSEELFASVSDSEQDKRIDAGTSMRLVKEIVDSVSNGINSIFQSQCNDEGSVINIFDGVSNKTVMINKDTIHNDRNITASTEENESENINIDLDRADIESIDTVFFDKNLPEPVNSLDGNLSTERLSVDSITMQETSHISSTVSLNALKKSTSKPRTSHELAIEYQKKVKRREEQEFTSRSFNNKELLIGRKEYSPRLSELHSFSSSIDLNKLSRDSLTLNKRKFEFVKKRIGTNESSSELQKSQSRSNESHKIHKFFSITNKSSSEICKNNLKINNIAHDIKNPNHSNFNAKSKSKEISTDVIPANIYEAKVKLTRFTFEELDEMIIIEKGYNEIRDEIRNITNIRKKYLQNKKTACNDAVINNSKNKNICESDKNDPKLLCRKNSCSKAVVVSEKEPKNTFQVNNLNKIVDNKSIDNFKAINNINKFSIRKNKDMSDGINYTRVINSCPRVAHHQKVNIIPSAGIDTSNQFDNLNSDQLAGANEIKTEPVDIEQDSTPQNKDTAQIPPQQSNITINNESLKESNATSSSKMTKLQNVAHTDRYNKENVTSITFNKYFNNNGRFEKNMNKTNGSNGYDSVTKHNITDYNNSLTVRNSKAQDMITDNINTKSIRNNNETDIHTQILKENVENNPPNTQNALLKNTNVTDNAIDRSMPDNMETVHNESSLINDIDLSKVIKKEVIETDKDNDKSDEHSTTESIKMEIIETYEEAETTSPEDANNVQSMETDAIAAGVDSETTAINKEIEHEISADRECNASSAIAIDSNVTNNSDSNINSVQLGNILDNASNNENMAMEITQTSEAISNNRRNSIKECLFALEAFQSAVNISSINCMQSDIVTEGTPDITKEKEIVANTEPVKNLTKETGDVDIHNEVLCNTSNTNSKCNHINISMDINEIETKPVPVFTNDVFILPDRFVPREHISSTPELNNISKQVNISVEHQSNNISNTNMSKNIVLGNGIENTNKSITIADCSGSKNNRKSTTCNLNTVQNQAEDNVNLHLENRIKTEILSSSNEEDIDLNISQLEFLKNKMIECRQKEICNLQIDVGNANKENLIDGSNVSLPNTHELNIKVESLVSEMAQAQRKETTLQINDIKREIVDNVHENLLVSPNSIKVENSPVRINSLMSSTKSTYQFTVVNKNVSIVSIKRRKKIKKEKVD